MDDLMRSDPCCLDSGAQCAESTASLSMAIAHGSRRVVSSGQILQLPPLYIGTRALEDRGQLLGLFLDLILCRWFQVGKHTARLKQRGAKACGKLPKGLTSA